MQRKDMLKALEHDKKKERKHDAKLRKNYYTKIVKAGRLYQIKTYSHEIDRSPKTSRSDYDKGIEGEKSSASLNRTRNNAMLLIEANLTKYTKFVTFTTREPIYCPDELDKVWKKFRMRFKYRYGYSMPYLKVVEGQKKRMAKYNLPSAPLHVHAVVFIDDYIEAKELAEVWGLGVIDIKQVKSADVGRYLMKYITKDADHLKLNKKGYHSSRKLKQPTAVFLDNESIPLRHDFFKTYDVKHPNIEDMTCAMYEVRMDAPPSMIDQTTGELVNPFKERHEKIYFKGDYQHD